MPAPSDPQDRPLNLEQEAHIEWDSTRIPKVPQAGESTSPVGEPGRQRPATKFRELLAEKFDAFKT